MAKSVATKMSLKYYSKGNSLKSKRSEMRKMISRFLLITYSSWFGLFCLQWQQTTCCLIIFISPFEHALSLNFPSHFSLLFLSQSTFSLPTKIFSFARRSQFAWSNRRKKLEKWNRSRRDGKMVKIIERITRVKGQLMWK